MENEFKISPLFDKIIIEPPAVETVTAGGVILPEVVGREKPMDGRAIAVGPDVKYVKNGDRVMFSKYAGVEIQQDGKVYLIMREEDIFAVHLD